MENLYVDNFYDGNVTLVFFKVNNSKGLGRHSFDYMSNEEIVETLATIKNDITLIKNYGIHDIDSYDNRSTSADLDCETLNDWDDDFNNESEYEWTLRHYSTALGMSEKVFEKFIKNNWVVSVVGCEEQLNSLL